MTTIALSSIVTLSDIKATGLFDDGTARRVGDVANLAPHDNEWLDELAKLCASRWAVRSALMLARSLLTAELAAFPVTLDEARWLVATVGNQDFVARKVAPLTNELWDEINLDDDDRDEQFLELDRQVDLFDRLDDTGLACHQALRYAVARWWSNEERTLQRASFEAAGLTLI